MPATSKYVGYSRARDANHLNLLWLFGIGWTLYTLYNILIIQTICYSEYMRHLSQYIPRSFLSFDGAKIYYEVSGNIHSSPILIFLHGLGGDLTAWDKEREYFLKKGYASIGFDLRGHGFSQRSKTKDFYNLDNFVKDIVMLIEYENLSNFILVGHCFGGIISLLLEGKYKSNGSGLVLVDTGYKAPYFSEFVVDHALVQMMLVLFSKVNLPLGNSKHADYDKFINTPDFDLKRIFSDILNTSLQSYLQICKSLFSFNGKELLENVTIPTLIIEGLQDSIFPLKMAKELHDHIKNSYLKLIPKANHIILLTDPKDLSEAIEEFAKKIFQQSNYKKTFST